MSASALTNSTAIGAGVRLLDNAVLPPTYNQLQQFRNFYNIDKLDVDRYIINGQEQDAVVATRELNLAGVPTSQKSWINEHLVYTHGYGFVAAPGDGVDNDGRPSFIESNIPVTGSLGTFQPRVYFGEGETSFSVVGQPAGATPREYDFPTNGGNGQQYTTYTGGGGVSIGSTFRQLEYALRFGDKNLILSDGINSDSRILYDRDPRQRVAKVAPYLTLDGDPYSAIVNGQLVWIVDGYTTSDGFPYSQRENLNAITQDTNTETATTKEQSSEKINYMRNSVKATVDAYTGAVTLYAWDATDPVLKTWMKVFPGTVKPESAMSTQLLAHVRYPEDIFKVQRNLLAKYHVTDPHAFYGQQDFWQVPADPTQTAPQPPQPPYYLTLKMPDQPKPTFSLTTTFVPQGRTNLSAFMAVDSDPGPDYGTIRVLQLPRSLLISGPGQVQNQFESDPNVQTTLNILRVQGGAAGVTYGNLLSLPVAGGLLYVEPVYVKAAGGQGSYPLLQKVLVSFGNNIGFQSTVLGSDRQSCRRAAGVVEFRFNRYWHWSDWQFATGLDQPLAVRPCESVVVTVGAGAVGFGARHCGGATGLRRWSGRAEGRRLRGLRVGSTTPGGGAGEGRRGAVADPVTESFNAAIADERGDLAERVAIAAAALAICGLRILDVK